MTFGTDSGPVADIAFWVLSVSSIVAAIAVVQLRDLFRVALFLVVSFLGVAGLFILLRAEFLAVVQVLIYVGAISVLILFAILMTRDVEQGSPSNRLQVPAGIMALLFLAAAAFVAYGTNWTLIEGVSWIGTVDTCAVKATTAADVFCNTVPRIAELLLRDYVLAFEIASVLLLAAIIGALALVREQ